MNKWTRMITAICLCAALCLGGVCAAFAQTASEQGQTGKAQNSETKQTQTAQQEVSKDETVYVLAGADGSVQKIIVSDWIKNALGSDSISDSSDLSDIENVKGDESYTVNGDNMKVWDAQGNDIYYQGNIEQELPVGLAVTYKLDDKTVSAEEIAGKSGKVTIRFDYSNHRYEMVEIDGKQEKIYVPFAMLTGMMLDSDTFRNVEVSNGKLINDGDHTIVVGLAFPGLQEDLALSRDKIDIPDYVEITADVTDFEFGMTVTIATNEVFNDLDKEKLDAADGADSSLKELTDAMTQLIDGSSALYDGLCTLLDKSNELVSGVDQLAGGAKAIKDGAGSLDDGAAQLKAGLAELSSGLNTLSSNSESMNKGAEQVFNTLLSTASAQLEAAGVPVPALTIDNYAQVLDGVIASLGADAEGKSGQTILALKASLDSYNSFYLGLRSYTGGVDSAASGAAGLHDGAAVLKDGTAQLRVGAETLCTGVLTLQDGMPALVDGVTALRDGSMELSDGLRQFNEQGVQKLADLLGGDLDGLAARLRATLDVSGRYQNFSGISEEMDGQVKFVYRTEEITAN